MQSPEYDWRLPPPPGTAAKPSWIVNFTDRMIGGIQSLYHRIGEALDRLFKWLFRRNAEASRPGGPPSTGLHWSIYVLSGAVVAAAIWIVWRKRRLGRAKAGSAAVSALPVRLDDEDLSADRLPEERWNELAEQSLREGNARLALRALYLASLAWLGRREYLAIDPGKTNREYELELRRRARAFPEARGLFAKNVAAFERAWYGMHEVAGDDVGEFRRRTDGLKSVLAAPQEAGA